MSAANGAADGAAAGGANMVAAIRALRAEAFRLGDEEVVASCDHALQNYKEALMECVRVLEMASEVAS